MTNFKKLIRVADSLVRVKDSTIKSEDYKESYTTAPHQEGNIFIGSLGDPSDWEVNGTVIVAGPTEEVSNYIQGKYHIQSDVSEPYTAAYIDGLNDAPNHEVLGFDTLDEALDGANAFYSRALEYNLDFISDAKKTGPRFSIKKVREEEDGEVYTQYCIIENATGECWEDTDSYEEAVDLVNRYNSAKSDPKDLDAFMKEVHPGF